MTDDAHATMSSHNCHYLQTVQTLLLPSADRLFIHILLTYIGPYIKIKKSETVKAERVTLYMGDLRVLFVSADEDFALGRFEKFL